MADQAQLPKEVSKAFSVAAAGDSPNSHDSLSEYRLGGNAVFDTKPSISSAGDTSLPDLAGELHKLTQANREVQKEQQEAARQQNEKRELAEADSLVQRIPGFVQNAARAGQDNATIMRIAGASASYETEFPPAPPKLDAAQQKVFDDLKSKGLNPTVEIATYERNELPSASSSKQPDFKYINSPPETAWVIKANWKDGQSPDPNLHALTEKQHDDAKVIEDQRRQTELKEEQAKAADAIQHIPDTVRHAAASGRDSAPIMFVSHGYYGDIDRPAPKLDEAQQRVFDALKSKGLNPSVELRDDYSADKDRKREESAWVITANWK